MKGVAALIDVEDRPRPLQIVLALETAEEILQELELARLDGPLENCAGTDTPASRKYPYWMGNLEAALCALMIAVRDEAEER